MRLILSRYIPASGKLKRTRGLCEGRYKLNFQIRTSTLFAYTLIQSFHLLPSAICNVSVISFRLNNCSSICRGKIRACVYRFNLRIVNIYLEKDYCEYYRLTDSRA